MSKEAQESVYWLECCEQNYSRLSFSRLRFSRITADLEVIIWSLFQHRHLTTGNKILWKREEIAPKERFLLFPPWQYFQYISNLRSQIKYLFVKCGWSIYFFPQFCKSDMSRYWFFRGSLGLRDNESRLFSKTCLYGKPWKINCYPVP